jgi:hypothetical protein
MEPYRTKFLLRAVYDVLPSPVNLCTTWKLADDPNCPLCGRPANLKHIMSGCPTALQKGRYRWRHDQTVAVIAHHLQLALNKQSKQEPCKRYATFVKAGEKGKGQTESNL